MSQSLRSYFLLNDLVFGLDNYSEVEIFRSRDTHSWCILGRRNMDGTIHFNTAGASLKLRRGKVITSYWSKAHR
jgi:hypothetical protein